MEKIMVKIKIWLFTTMNCLEEIDHFSRYEDEAVSARNRHKASTQMIKTSKHKHNITKLDVLLYSNHGHTLKNPCVNEKDKPAPTNKDLIAIPCRKKGK